MNKLRIAAIITAILGLADAIYLAIIKFSNNKALCIQGVGDCWSVNTSRYSEIGGIPVSILGALAYLAIIVILLFELKVPVLTSYGAYLLFGITLVGVIYSAYLTYLEIAVIKAICPFCVVSAILMIFLFGYSLFRLAKPGID